MCAPLNVYLLNVLFPEEQVMNVCIKTAAIMPPTNLMPAEITLGGQLFRDAQRDFVFFINTKVELSEIMPKRKAFIR